ncbi:MAG: sulfatase [Acidobacteriota bacterium]
MHSLRPILSSSLTAILLAALVVLGAAFGCTPSGSEPTASNPGVRVVLITLDTLRYDATAGEQGASGMPALAAWSQEAKVFTRHFSATASTQPSHASMLTGQHPWQHGVDRNGAVLSPEALTVPEVLKEQGFSTAAAVASFPVAARFGFHQGFDVYRDDFSRGSVGDRWVEDAKKNDPDFAAPGGFYNLADVITERALDILDKTEGHQQFFWFHYFDPHSPYGNTAAVDGDGPAETMSPRPILEAAAAGEDPWPEVRRAQGLYSRDVSFLDRQLDRLLQRLLEDEDRFKTHVIITADHGESFGEDNSLAHGRRVTPAQIHTPLMIRSSLAEPGVVDHVAGSVDVGETLLVLADAQAPRNQGRNLLATPQRPPRAYGMRRLYDPPYADRRLDGTTVEISGPLFYMVDRDGKLYRGTEEELLPSVSGTDVHLASAEDVPPALQEPLRKLFRTFEQELEGALQSENLDQLDEESRAALRALGYTQ